MAEVQGGAGDYSRSTRDMLAQSGDEAYRQARTAFVSAVEEQKQQAARSLVGVARSLHEMARSLTSENQEVGARYTDLAAEQIERAAQALETRTVDALMSDVERFARRQPAMFLGGAVAAGFVLARFLKSSEARVRDDDSAYGGAGADYGSEAYRPPASPYGAAGDEPVSGGI